MSVPVLLQKRNPETEYRNGGKTSIGGEDEVAAIGADGGEGVLFEVGGNADLPIGS